MKPIITDTYDFPTLVGEGYVYVDKTALLKRMVSGVDGRFFFMSRPRRFGKSLMISTLEQIFKGNRGLFRGLAIAKTNYDWKPYPVIRLDMSQIRAPDIAGCRRVLCALLADMGISYSLDLSGEDNPGRSFGRLIETIKRRDGKVVVLIDEYDAPIGGLLENPEMFGAARSLLHDFYLMLKVHVEDIHFLMMTGVSKFTKLSVFSGMNNLTDISMSPVYAALLGYTRTELEQVFKPHVKAFAVKLKKSPEAIVREILAWYDSYRFSPESNVRVCNPVSVGRALQERRFYGFWDATGSATLIVERLRKLGKSAKAALKQCHSRKYAAPYAADSRRIVYVGVNYDTLKRNVDTLNDTLNSRMLSLIRQRPGLRRPDLMAALNVSESTVARCLREMRESIGFRGPSKTGGYFILESSGGAQ